MSSRNVGKMSPPHPMSSADPRVTAALVLKIIHIEMKIFSLF